VVETRLAMAERHVREGRRTIERQRELIASQTARRVDTVASEALLQSFERSLAIFEDDLRRIVKAG